MPPERCCTALRLVSIATTPLVGTPSSSGASAAHSRKPPNPIARAQKPMRAGERVSVGSPSFSASACPRLASATGRGEMTLTSESRAVFGGVTTGRAAVISGSSFFAIRFIANMWTIHYIDITMGVTAAPGMAP